MSETHKPRPPVEWRATWEDARLDQLTIGLAATPAQRLAWLEEMLRLAYATGALPRQPR